MSHRGKSHVVIMFTVGPDDVAEGDRIFASHGEWMPGHPREGWPPPATLGRHRLTNHPIFGSCVADTNSSVGSPSGLAVLSTAIGSGAAWTASCS
jgi:hypothetical protein